jgi:hypothetical protein
MASTTPRTRQGGQIVESFSGDKYRLMESIFSWEEDIAFLASQPGYDREIGLKHRIAKRKLAYEWLRELKTEFDDLYHQGLKLLVNSDVDRPDFQRALWRLKLTFYRRVAFVKLCLLWRAPAADEVRQLSTALENLIGYACIIRDESVLPYPIRG